MEETLFVEQLVLAVTLLLFVASAVAAAVKRVRLPYTVALVITGALLALFGREAAQAQLVSHELLDHFRLQPGVVLYVLLPILLFEAAFNLDSRRLLKNLLPIVVLAVPAVIISTGIVGAVLYLFGDVPHSKPLTGALLFGAMVSTTDAVAVVAIFRELGAPKRLTVLVEGEALFNSGTALVVFTIVAAILLAPGEGPTAVALAWGAVRDFCVMALGGVAVGIALGFVISQVIARVEEDPLIEITLTTVCAPLAFLLGGALGVSDVMSVIGAGLTVGNYGRTKISPAVQEPLEHYWHYLAFVANSIIFLLVGFSLRAAELVDHAEVIAVGIGAVLLARAFGIFPVIALVNRFVPQRIGVGTQTIMWWGGIRGALVLVMALGLSQYDESILAALGGSTDAPAWGEWLEFRSYVLHLAFGVVFFTILVNAPTTKSLIGLMGLSRYTPSERYEEKQTLLLAKRNVRERLSELKNTGLVSGEVHDLLAERYLLSEGQLRRELSELRASRTFTAEDERRTLLRHCMGGEKAHLAELFMRGDVGEGVMKDLHIALDNQLDRLNLGEEPDEDELAELVGARLRERVLHGLARRLSGTGRLGAALRTRALGRQYEAARARLSAIREALDELERVARVEAASEASVRWVRDFYERQRAVVRARLESLAQVFPEYAAQVQEALSERYCLRSEEELFRWLAARGRLSAKVLKDALASIRLEMMRLRGRSRSGRIIRPVDLVQRISFFTGLSAREAEELAGVLRPIAFAAGEEVVREGALSDAMYLIARGEVEVLVRGEGGEQPVAQLGPGDFFGEIALLTRSPRTASVRTRTACALLELRRRDLERIEGAFPHVREVLEDAYRARVLSTILARLPIFAELGAGERALLAEALRLRRFSAGELLRRADGVADALWIVKSGRLRHELETGPVLLEEGSSLGEEELCFPAAAEGAVVAETAGELLALRHLEFLSLLERRRDLRRGVANAVHARFGRELPRPERRITQRMRRPPLDRP